MPCSFEMEEPIRLRLLCFCIMISFIQIRMAERGNRDRIKFSSFIIYSNNTILNDDDYSQLHSQLYYNSSYNSATTNYATTDSD